MSIRSRSVVPLNEDEFELDFKYDHLCDGHVFSYEGMEYCMPSFCFPLFLQVKIIRLERSKWLNVGYRLVFVGLVDTQSYHNYGNGVDIWEYMKVKERTEHLCDMGVLL